MTHVSVRAKIIQDNTGALLEFPAIVTELGVLQPLVDYFLEMSQARSYSWMQKVVQSVSLLLDYLAANQHCFDDPKSLFSAFVRRLQYGTIGENGLDPSGLFWLPKKVQNAKQLVLVLSEFSDWLSHRLEGIPLNPMAHASRYDEMLNWAAYHQRHHRAFLGHTWSRHKESQTSTFARRTQLKSTPKASRAGVKFFPEDKIGDLLFRGFVVPGRQRSPRLVDRLNLRDILITILMHGGGLRVSEPFHLYIHDVQPDFLDPTVAMVRIYHPEEGMAPSDWPDAKGQPVKCSRSAYLLGKHSIQPRTQYPKNGSLHAGWKSPHLDHQRDLYMHVHWFPRAWGRLFKQLWDLYLLQLVQVERHHPFAFVSFDGRYAGEPYSICAFREAHARAVERIGLTVAKLEGTTGHGHRHAYGQRVKETGDPLIIKAALHHRSLESQLVYTEAQIAEVSQKLEEATSRLNSGGTIMNSPDLTAYGFEDVDPLGLLSGPRPLLKKGL
jgi:integrase